MLLPAVILLLIFHYYPIYGAQIAFKRFNPALGIWGSQWVGLDNINRFFNSIQFWSILWNTFSIKLFMIIAGFPVPIIIALIINEIPSKRFKKFVQTTIFAPHFISTVVMIGLIFLFTHPSKGIINHAIASLGFERIPFMSQPEWFRFVYIVSGIWQNSGWGAIIYIACLSGIDPEQHEAAMIDGASRLRRIWSINLPGILPTIIILLIMDIGKMLSLDYEKIYLMQTPLNLGVSEVLSTYIFKTGIEQGQFSYSAAIGLFLNIINLVLLIIFNKLAKSVNETSLW